MFGLVKIAGISAVLSAGLVTAFEAPGAPERAPIAGQKFSDRLPQDDGQVATRVTAVGIAGSETPAGETKGATGKGDLQRIGVDCAGQVWPHIAHRCLTSVDGKPVRQATRTITVEERRGRENVSVLVRLPAVEVAQR